jgi:hypothetical protein
MEVPTFVYFGFFFFLWRQVWVLFFLIIWVCTVCFL